MPDLLNVINRILALKNLKAYDERKTEQAVILPILDALGWKVFDTEEVQPQYAVGNDRVDYALCYPPNKVVLCEVKKPAQTDPSHPERQLLKYAYQQGAELAILTNGTTWWLYLGTLAGPWDQRRFKTVELSESPEDAAQWLTKFLSKEAVCTGQAKSRAEEVNRTRKVQETIREYLPKAWLQIRNTPPEPLVDLLANCVETMCDIKPEAAAVAAFIKELPLPAIVERKTKTESGKLKGEKPWLTDGKLWHLEHRCGQGTKAMFLKLDQALRKNFELDGPRWNQKLYIAYRINRFKWLTVFTGSNILQLDFMLKRGALSENYVAKLLGVERFDPKRSLSEKLGLPSSVIIKNCRAQKDRLRLRLKEGFDVSSPNFIELLEEARKASVR